MGREQIFDFPSYREYLYHRLGRPGQRTGMRLKACKVLGCHTSYLSQVLGGRAHLSLEHAEALSRFLNHTSDEGEYFLNLVLRDRAGTKALRERFAVRLREVRARRNLIATRVKNEAELSAPDQDRFYSHWVYTAIHALVSIPAFQNPEALAGATGLSIGAIHEALEFLERIGIVVKKTGGLQPGPRVLHLGSESPLISKHHTNWRFHGIQSLLRARPEDLHYSAVFSLSQEAVQKIRETLLRLLEENIEQVKTSKPSEAYIYCFDFYQLN